MIPLAVCFVVALLFQTAAADQRLTLQEALHLAERNHPALAAARSLIAPAQANLVEARAALWHNPELSMEVRHRELAQRESDDLTEHDAAVGLTQTFEIAGQPRARRAAAEASLEASRYAVDQTRFEVRLEVATEFVDALQLRRRLEAEQASAELFHQAADIIAKRVKAGEDTRLDANIALVEAERASTQVMQTGDELARARAKLAATLQLPPNVLPEPFGSLTETGPSYRLRELLGSVARHPRIQATTARVLAARHQLTLELAARIPDVTLGLTYSPERTLDGTDEITTLSVNVPLPFFRNNDSAIAQANAELMQSESALQSAQRDTEAAIRVLWQRLTKLRQQKTRLEGIVLPILQDTQRLSLAAMRAGEINVTEFLLARRQTIEAQRELADAQAQAVVVRLELENAAGWEKGGAPPNGQQDFPIRTKESP